MANNKFPRLSCARLSSETFKPLLGVSVPAKSPTNTGLVGKFLDEYVKTQLNLPHDTTVDLEFYGIEIKSKDNGTTTDWSIGAMTLEDIIKKSYTESSIYQKCQSLLLITTDDNFRKVVDVGLYYMDLDEVQQLIEESYEDVRRQLIYRITEHNKKIQNMVVSGNIAAILNPIEFGSYEKFQGKYGKFEYTNNGTSFQFRITSKQMRHLTQISASSKIADVLFI